MIPYDVDPSLHDKKPVEPVLDDGFSPPEEVQPSAPSDPLADASADPLGGKSGF